MAIIFPCQCGPGVSVGNKSQLIASCPFCKKASLTIPENSQPTNIFIHLHISQQAHNIRNLVAHYRAWCIYIWAILCSLPGTFDRPAWVLSWSWSFLYLHFPFLFTQLFRIILIIWENDLFSFFAYFSIANLSFSSILTLVCIFIISASCVVFRCVHNEHLYFCCQPNI